TPQTIQEIPPSDLLAAVHARKAAGDRLVQICATTLEHFELTYTFANPALITHLRLHIPRQNPTLPSITDLYFGAFAYENEIHDLFGISITGNRVDYHGNFFKISRAAPFAEPCSIPVKKVPS
ncbi:MAG TPA: NADH-quinone oxidoreductase subunit C, partial [Kiritimatiellia bacterium]|nr:NADH-quinone oxidoreductase subunit C [Kiritimatiellia bacterium]